MIPKVIHYCWFGGNPLPELVLKCIESWEKYCPEYEIKKWDEKCFDVNAVSYTREAHQAKKWAFVSDYARLKIIYDYGGIYLDTDVELIRPLDSLLKEHCFLGAEKDGYVATGLGFGAEKGNRAVGLMLKEYEDKAFVLPGGVYNLKPCPVLNTDAIRRIGYEFSEDAIWENEYVKVYPPEYFCPMDDVTKDIRITNNTYSIHHFSASWFSDREKEIKEAVDYVNSHYTGIRRLVEKQKKLYAIGMKYGYCGNYADYLLKRTKEKLLLRIH